MKVNQAGIYIVEEDENEEKFIELKSCYAFDRNKSLTKRIEIGQGLVGQCYLERERIFMKEVPPTYINITSGLGDATPKCILIVPLIQEEHVEGIIELASFNVLEEHEIQFVEKLAESLASYVASNRINMKTKELLERFQQQSEELRAQEEEMRQNMEEMQATQEEIHRKEKEYIQKIEELERALGPQSPA
jgi:methyl-accepting chemotaxis protein